MQAREGWLSVLNFGGILMKDGRLRLLIKSPISPMFTLTVFPVCLSVRCEVIAASRIIKVYLRNDVSKIFLSLHNFPNTTGYHTYHYSTMVQFYSDQVMIRFRSYTVEMNESDVIKIPNTSHIPFPVCPTIRLLVIDHAFWNTVPRVEPLHQT